MTKRYHTLIALALLACCNIYAQTSFKVNRAWINPSGNQDAKFMVLLGENKYGQQIWHQHYNYSESRLSFHIGDAKYKLVYSNSAYHKGSYDCNDVTQYSYPNVTGNTQHFILTAGETNLLYGGYTDGAWAYVTPGADITLHATTLIQPDEIKIDEFSGLYTQDIHYTVNGLSRNALDKINLYASYDGGSTWSAVSPDVAVIGGSGSQSRGTYTTTLPENVQTVRYYAEAVPRDSFKIIVPEGEVWRSDTTADCILPSTFIIPGKLKVDHVKDTYTDAASITKRTYKPTIAWDIPFGFTDVIDHATIEYCPYGTGDEWETLVTTTSLYGSKQITIPVAADSLLFRLTVTPKATATKFVEEPAATVLVDNAYQPAFSNLALTGTLCQSYDEDTQTFNPTLVYTMNDDLYRTRMGKAFVYGSFDDGATWSLIQSIDSPAQSGSVQLTLSAQYSRYQFRMGIASGIDNDITCGIEGDSKIYVYTPVYVLDDNVSFPAETITNRDVKVLRSFDSGSVGTICLPFSLTEEQIAQGFGANAKIYQYTSLSESTLNFSRVTAIEAGKPYLVKTAENKDYLYFPEIDIDGSVKPQSSDVSTSYVFTGIFSPYLMATDQSEYFFTSGGKLKYPSTAQGANRLRGYRCLIEVFNTANKSPKISLDGTVTGIDAVTLDGDAPVRVYNVNGQYVGNSLEGLPKGVYVVGNKKVVVNK